MMCGACEQRLEGYLEGGLDVYTLARVQRHLARCASCRAMLDELRAAEKLLNETSRAAALEPPPNFTFAVMAQARATAAPHPQPLMRWAFLGWYLLGAWVLVGVLAFTARPLLLHAFAALFGSARTALAIVQALAGAVSTITDGHAAAIAAIVGVVLAADLMLAAGVYVLHTRLELA